MNKNTIFSFIVASLFLSSCAPMSKGPRISDEAAFKEAAIQQEIAAKEFMQDTLRVDRLSTPIRLANVSMCGERVAPYWGIGLATKDSFPDQIKDGMNRLYNLQEQPTVYLVNKNSPAYGTLKNGDVIVMANDKKVSAGRSGINQLAKIQQNGSSPDPIKLGISRSGKNIAVTIKPKLACSSQFYVANDETVNAYADGTNVFVTKGMLRFAQKDTELALVMGHELAHNTRGHMEAKQGNAIIGVLLGAVVMAGTGVDMTQSFGQIGASAYSQDFEAEADYVGLYHTARAGYDIGQAPLFWRRMGAANPAAIDLAGSTHPSSAKRYVALEMTVKEIKAKKAKGGKLVPDEQEVEQIKKDVGQLN